MSLTPRLHEIELLEAIARAWEAPQPLPPTHRELVEATSYQSTSAIAYQLDCFAAKGWITREPGRSRALWLTPLAAAWAWKRGIAPVSPRYSQPD